MSVETDFYALLSGSAGVTALVADRIYPDAMPEKCAYPAVVFSRAGTVPVYLISGSMAAAEINLSVGCWSETRTQADQVADAVQAALAGSEFVIGRRDGAFDPETGLIATLIEVSILETY